MEAFIVMKVTKLWTSKIECNIYHPPYALRAIYHPAYEIKEHITII